MTRLGIIRTQYLNDFFVLLRIRVTESTLLILSTYNINCFQFLFFLQFSQFSGTVVLSFVVIFWSLGKVKLSFISFKL